MPDLQFTEMPQHSLPAGVRISIISGFRVPVLCIAWPSEERFPAQTLGKFLADLLRGMHKSNSAAFPRLFDCRCVPLSRLPHIMLAGVDVEPTSFPIYVSGSVDKALEYGDVLMVFDRAHLEATYREVAADASEEERIRCRRKYVSETPALDGSGSLWFSMLKADDTRLAKPYEIEYGRWIPGDPWAALKLVAVIGTDHELLAKAIRSAAIQPHGGNA